MSLCTYIYKWIRTVDELQQYIKDKYCLYICGFLPRKKDYVDFSVDFNVDICVDFYEQILKNLNKDVDFDVLYAYA